MLSAVTENNALSVIPAEAGAALLGSSSSGYSTKSDASATPITLTVAVNSADPPTIILVSFIISGVKQVNFDLTSTTSGDILALPPQFTDATPTTVFSQLQSPVSADTVVITLAPAAANTEVIVSSMFVSACYTPGIFSLVL